MKNKTINGITRLTAAEGKVLTNGVTSGTEVWLSPQDSESNWIEQDSPPPEPTNTDPESIITEMEGLL